MASHGLKYSNALILKEETNKQKNNCKKHECIKSIISVDRQSYSHHLAQHEGGKFIN